MLAAPKYGFVFLASTKAASTAIQRAFKSRAQVLFSSPPSLKHLTAADFESDVAPLLVKHGYPRSSYVTTCLVREPIDLTVSWWRYRSRPGLVGRPNYTGEMSFDEFVDRVVSGQGAFRTPSQFAADDQGRTLVDRIFRYEHLEACVAWMAELSRAKIELERVNVSPRRTVEISAASRAKLEEFYAADLALYEAAE